MIKYTYIYFIFFLILVLLIMVGIWLGAISQPQSYHDFADKRSWLGIPNAWNVLSNIAFLLAGIYGLFILKGRAFFSDKKETYPWFGVAIGLLLTALGSAYYHLNPNDSRLVWDRLPMTLISTSLIAALIGERINIKLGLSLWPILIVYGFFSVLYWYATEQMHQGDLRFYISVQGLSMLILVAMFFTHSPYNRNFDLVVALFLYALAILCEFSDHWIYFYTGEKISGHTLKHFLAAAAIAWLLRMTSKRKLKKEH